MPRRVAPRRRAAVLLESAFAHLAFLTLLILLIVAGFGTLRYQAVSWMACEAARYASVHGNNYAKELNSDAPTTQTIHDQIVRPLAVNMDPAKLTVQIAFVDKATGQVSDWDSSDKSPTSVAGPSGQPRPVTNHVRVTVSYEWFPEMFLAGPVLLTSTAELPMAF